MATINYYYTKSILEKVSKNPSEFNEELKEAHRRLLPFEITNLTKWLYFYTTNKPELKKFIEDLSIKIID